MKRKSLLIVFILTTLVLSCLFSEGFASNGLCDMSRETIIKLTVTNPHDAWIKLKSYKGTAVVDTHFMSVFSSGQKDESHHGFYYVMGYGFGGSFRWVPSATRWILDYMDNWPQIEDEEVTLYFQSAGDYEITIRPMSTSDASQYWKVDSIVAWKEYPYWGPIDYGSGITSLYFLHGD